MLSNAERLYGSLKRLLWVEVCVSRTTEFGQIPIYDLSGLQSDKTLLRPLFHKLL